jgi:hypothetical protein
MIAIETKYLPATNFKGARIKAFTFSGFNITIPCDYSLTHEKVYFKAVKELIKKYKLEWNISKMTLWRNKRWLCFLFL